MPTIEQVKQRRTNLVAQRDQHIANVNATSGAIMLCDELIAEAEAAGRIGEGLPPPPPVDPPPPKGRSKQK